MQSPISSSQLSAIALVLLLLLLVRRALKKPPGPFPPGPPPLPLIGNLLDIPFAYQWKTYAQWNRRWGDIVYIKACGQRVIILSSLEAAIDLLGKRDVHSDRPTSYLAGRFLGWDQLLPFCPYNLHLRNMRRVLHRNFGGYGQLEKMDRYHELIESEVHKFLARLLDRPEDFAGHIRKTAGGIILRVAYGYRAQEGKDPFVEMVELALNGLTTASAPESFLLDIIPALRWVPDWFPGAAWKQRAAKWCAETEAMIEVPFKRAKAEAIRDVDGNSLVGAGIQDITYEEEEHGLKLAAASLYPGGADMTVCAISNFFLTMVLYPNIQKKAQQEIDYIIGTRRLPTLADRAHLPYLNALCLEIYRWNPSAPLGLPRRSTSDDFYMGYFVPKGSLVFVNIWQILRDPDVYSEPLTFKPERFMGEHPEQDPRSAAFGFGRRICPGTNLAEASIFAVCTMILAAFNISKAVENGKEIIPSVMHGPGLVSHPLPFKCRIEPRSPTAVSLIREG